MNKLTLGYWKARGRGQVPRLLLAYTDTQFEDVQYKDSKEWEGEDKQKLKLDFPDLPYLIDGDFKITESQAISAYIIERSKKTQLLLGKGIKERAKVLSVLCVIRDISDRIRRLIYDPEVKVKREEVWKEFISERIKRLESFRGGKQWLFDRLTLPDFMLAELSYYIESVFPNEYKQLKFLHEERSKFLQLPEIKSYYEKQSAVKGPFTNMQKANIKF